MQPLAQHALHVPHDEALVGIDAPALGQVLVVLVEAAGVARPVPEDDGPHLAPGEGLGHLAGVAGRAAGDRRRQVGVRLLLHGPEHFLKGLLQRRVLGPRRLGPRRGRRELQGGARAGGGVGAVAQGRFEPGDRVDVAGRGVDERLGVAGRDRGHQGLDGGHQTLRLPELRALAVDEGEREHGGGGGAKARHRRILPPSGGLFLRPAGTSRRFVFHRRAGMPSPPSLARRRAPLALVIGGALVAATIGARAETPGGSVLHEFIPPDPGDDVTYAATTLDGDLPAAIQTPSGLATAPDPRQQPSADHVYGGGATTDDTPDSTYEPDRDTRRPHVENYDDPFSPATAPFKRLRAYDWVEADYSLHVRDKSLQKLSAGGTAAAGDEPFYGDISVDLIPGQPVRIPTVGPGARILRMHFNPELAVDVLHDGADNWFLRGATRARVRLVVELAIPRDTFGREFADVDWSVLDAIEASRSPAGARGAHGNPEPAGPGSTRRPSARWRRRWASPGRCGPGRWCARWSTTSAASPPRRSRRAAAATSTSTSPSRRRACAGTGPSPSS